MSNAVNKLGGKWGGGGGGTCPSPEKITLYKILLITSFSPFLPNFGNISAKCRIRQSVVSAKCLFGKVVFGEVSRTLQRHIQYI